MTIRIRSVHQHDTKDIIYLMRKLAVYQGIEHRYEPSSERLALQLSSTGNPQVHGFLAFKSERPVGYCLFYIRDYSSFRSRWMSLHLEDLFVEETERRHGIGRQLLSHIAQEARARGVDAVTLSVHTENAEGKALYKKLGATPPPGTDWEPLQFGSEVIERLAK